MMTHQYTTSLSLRRLRAAIGLCAATIVGCLIANIICWALLAFTDMRHEQATDPSAATAIVFAEQADGSVVSILPHDKAAPRSASTVDKPTPANINRIYSKYDAMLSNVVRFARGFGSMAVLMMIPLILAGVLLTSSVAAPGGDRTVTSFCWALAVSMLTLPIGHLLGLPWRDGGFCTYPTMTAPIDALAAKSADNMVGLDQIGVMAYVRFIALPLACLVGTCIVLLRFNDGVVNALLPHDSRLDPALEKEAANIKPSSLHGGRSAGALRAAVTAPVAGGSPMPAASSPPMESRMAAAAASPPVGQPMQGAPLRRLI